MIGSEITKSILKLENWYTAGFNLKQCISHLPNIKLGLQTEAISALQFYFSYWYWRQRFPLRSHNISNFPEAANPPGNP